MVILVSTTKSTSERVAVYRQVELGVVHSTQPCLPGSRRKAGINLTFCLLIFASFLGLPKPVFAQQGCTPPTVTLANIGSGSCVGTASLSVSSNQAIGQISWFNGTTLVYSTSSQSATSGSTVAGGNGVGSGANQLNQPNGVFVDANRTVYVVDYNNHRVQKWLPGATSGVTVAGGNGQGSAADQLNSPVGVFVDGTGAVYVADQANNRVQKWSVGASSGITVAGGGIGGSGANQLNGPQGVFVDGTGAVYVSDFNNNRVQKWAAGATSGTTVAGGNGSGSGANQLTHPEGVFVDASGAVYVADVGNDRVQKWAAGASSGTTVAGGNGAGNAANQLNGPRGIYVNGRGTLYISDGTNQRIQKWAAGASSGTTVAATNLGPGSGPAQFNGPYWLWVDGSGAVYVSDFGNDRVQKWAVYDDVYTPVSAGSYSALITGADGCTATTNTITVAAPFSMTITPTPSLTVISGQQTTLTASGAATYMWDTGATTATITVNKSGIYSVIGYMGGCQSVTTITLVGPICDPPIVSLTNIGLGNCVGAMSLSVSSEQAIAQLSWFNGTTLVYSTSSQSATSGTTVAGGNGVGSGTNQLNQPNGVFVDANRTVYVVDRSNHRVQKWVVGASSGITVAGGNGQGSAADQLNAPVGVFVDANGAVYVADQANHRVQKWAAGASSGTTVAGGGIGGSGANQLNAPQGVFVDGTGAVYVVDNNNNRVQKWAAGATSGTTVAGTSGTAGSGANELNGPQGVFVDANGAVYVADYANNRIQKWAAGASSGTTVAGGNGAGNAANQLNGPRGIYVNNLGTIYISDGTNQRIQKWAAGAISGTTVAATTLGPGSGPAQFNGPNWVWVDDGGSIYVSDFGNARVQKWLSNDVTYTPGRPGNYSVKITLTTGCTAITNTITAEVPFSVGITATPSITVTPDQRATLTASGATTYIWSTGATTAAISVNTPAVYSVTGISGGCQSVTTITIVGPPCTAPTVSLTYLGAGNCLGIASLSVSSNQSISQLSWFKGTTLVSAVNSYSIATVAGGNGDGSGTNQLNLPQGVFVDANQTVYVVDRENHRVQKWVAGATSGITVAGGNGQGSAANQLNSPTDLFVDANGAVYVSDQGNYRVQKWAAGANSGTTVAGGSGGSGASQLNVPEGVFVDAAGAVYVADLFNHRVQKWAAGATSGTTVAGGNGGGLEANQLNLPEGVFVDASGAIYVSDYNNNRVQKWAAGATSGTTVAGGNGAGNASTQLQGPRGIYVDGTGTIYISDGTNQRIQKWAAGATSGTTVAATTSGPGSGSAQFNGPYRVWVDGNGSVYVSDFGNARVQKWTPVPVSPVYIPSTTGSYTARITGTNGCTASTSAISIAGTPSVSVTPASQTITAGQSATLTASGATSYRWSNGATGATIAVSLTSVQTNTYSVTGTTGICSATATASVSATPCLSPTVSLASSGNCLGAASLSITSNQVISRLDWYRGTNLIYTNNPASITAGSTVAGGNGDGPADNQLNNPSEVFIDKDGAVYVVDIYNNRIQKWTAGATTGITVAGGNGDGAADNQLSFPAGMYVDASGAIYVSDFNNNRVQKWAAGATSGTTVAGGNDAGPAANQLDGPYAVFVDGTGAVYVSEVNNHRVQKWAAGATSGTTVAGGNDAGDAANQLNFPFGIYVDANQSVYVADGSNNRIQKWVAGASSGITVAGGNGDGPGADQLSFPNGVFVDGSGGVYVADAMNNRIQKWAAGASSGITVAGGNGDGPGADQFNYAASVFVDGNGAVYVGDSYNHRVQRWERKEIVPAYTPDSPGTYSVLVTSVNGCATASNSITISAPPSVSISPSSQTITAGLTATLTASGATSYRWSTGETTATIVIRPTGTTAISSTAISVTGITSGCTGMTTATITIAPPVCGTAVFVTEAGAGAKNGSNWANAFDKTQVQLALNTAVICAIPIYIAQGTYTPTETPASCTDCTSPRDVAFQLPSGVQIYGGFPASGNPTFAQRNPALYITKFSGEIGTTGPDDNAFHVLVAVNTGPNTRIDGITIADGGGQEESFERDFGLGGSSKIDTRSGAGLAMGKATLLVENVTFSNNRGTRYGGGLYNGQDPAVTNTLTISNSRFIGNSASNGGGLYGAGSESLTITGTTFENNSAVNGGNGGGAYLSQQAIITNSVFASNLATYGGGIYADKNLVLKNTLVVSNSASQGGGAYTYYDMAAYNCTFASNSANTGGGVYVFNSATDGTHLYNTIVWGNTGGSGNELVKENGQVYLHNSLTSQAVLTNENDEGGNLSIDPLFFNASNAKGADGLWGTADDGFSLKGCSPAINKGDNAQNTAIVDVANLTRVISSTIDMGAYEFQSSPIVLTITAAVSKTLACTGEILPLTASASGGTTYSYSWSASNGVTLPASATGSTLSVTMTVAGQQTFTVTATDAGGCTSTTTLSSSVVDGVSITAQPATSSVVCVGSSISVPVSLTGSVVSQQWYKGTTAVANQTATTLSLPSATTADAGDYKLVVVSTACGSLTSSSFSLTVSETVAIIQGPVASSVVCSGRSVSVPVSITGAGATYQWYVGNVALATQKTATLNLSAVTTNEIGSYKLVVTGGCNSVTSSSFSLSVNIAPAVTITPSAITIVGGQSATLTASGASSYTWNTPSNLTTIVVSPIEATVYSVSGSLNGCLGQATAMVSVICGELVLADAISVTQTAVLSSTNCSVMLKGYGHGTGYIITGPGGYVFSAVYRKVGYYSLNAPDITKPGTYTFTVNYSDACRRTSSDTMTYLVTGTACK